MTNAKFIAKMKITNQGERLLILVKRDKMSTDEIAAAMGVTSTYLPKLYKKQILSNKIVDAACTVFGVDHSYFKSEGDILEEPAPTYKASINSEPPSEKELALLAEVQRLKQQVYDKAEEIIKLLEEKDELKQEKKELMDLLKESMKKK